MISIDPKEVEAMMRVQVQKAIKSLAGYKFLMFGYHAATWVNLNKTLPRKHRQGNPFKQFVDLANTTNSEEKEGES